MFSMFNTGPIKTQLSHHGCYGGVVKAFFESCEEPICFVNYSQVDADFVIHKFGVSSSVSAKVAQIAGDEINEVLKKEAAKLGVTRLLIVKPDCSEAEVIETYKVQPHVLRALPQNTKPFYLN
jgi:hypothetical protein